MTGETTEEGLPRNLKLWQYRAYCLCREQHVLIYMFLSQITAVQIVNTACLRAEVSVETSYSTVLTTFCPH